MIRRVISLIAAREMAFNLDQIRRNEFRAMLFIAEERACWSVRSCRATLM
jgi:hypothetical protein